MSWVSSRLFSLSISLSHTHTHTHTLARTYPCSTTDVDIGTTLQALPKIPGIPAEERVEENWLGVVRTGLVAVADPEKP
jgi:hypothetical protein